MKSAFLLLAVMIASAAGFGHYPANHNQCCPSEYTDCGAYCDYDSDCYGDNYCGDGSWNTCSLAEATYGNCIVCAFDKSWYDSYNCPPGYNDCGWGCDLDEDCSAYNEHSGHDNEQYSGLAQVAYSCEPDLPDDDEGGQGWYYCGVEESCSDTTTQASCVNSDGDVMWSADTDSSCSGCCAWKVEDEEIECYESSGGAGAADDCDMNDMASTVTVQATIDAEACSYSAYVDAGNCTYSGDTSGECTQWGSGAPDQWYVLQLNSATWDMCTTSDATSGGALKIDTCGSSYDTYVRIFDMDGDGNPGNEHYECDDCGSNTCSGYVEDDDGDTGACCWTVATPELDAGTYWLLIEGYACSEGAYQFTVECADQLYTEM